MNTDQSYKYFAMLCESLILNEDSTTISVLGKQNPNIIPLIKYAHKNLKLPHDISGPTRVEKFDWQYIKQRTSGWRPTGSSHWLFIVGKTGVGLVIPESGNWKAYAKSNDGDQVNHKVTHKISDALSLIRDSAGTLKEFYQTVGTAVPEKPKYLAPEDTPVSVEALMKKFSPVIGRSTQKAIADLRGMVITQIKNDAYDKVEKRIKKLNMLTNMYDKIQGGDKLDSSTNEYLKTMLVYAIQTTAEHFYPSGEDLGGHNLSRMGLNRGNALQVTLDIARGDNSKLSMVLYYFRRELVAS